MRQVDNRDAQTAHLSTGTAAAEPRVNIASRIAGALAAGSQFSVASQVSEWDVGHWSYYRIATKRLLEDPSSTAGSAWIHGLYMILVVISVICAILETVPELTGFVLFLVLEPFFTALFTIELCLRIWTSTRLMSFFSKVANIVDILATLGGYSHIFIAIFSVRVGTVRGNQFNNLGNTAQAMRVTNLMRLFRMLRMLRVLRVANAFRQFNTMVLVVKAAFGAIQALWIMGAMLAVSIIVGGTLCYGFEVMNKTRNMESIPGAIWWSASTILQVGYGDVVPQTVGGKFVAILTSMLGVIVTSICISIVTNSFTIQLQRYQHAERVRNMQKLFSKTMNSTGLLDANSTDLARINHVVLLNELEDMTQELLLQMEASYHSRANDAVPMGMPGKPDDDWRFARLTLEILRQQSNLWFQHARRMSETYLVQASEAATAKVAAAAAKGDEPKSNGQLCPESGGHGVAGRE